MFFFFVSPVPAGEWRQIAMAPRYDVHSSGKVRNHFTNRILSTQTFGGRRYPYKYVTIKTLSGVKNVSMHRLVALAFIPNDQNLPVVNHKDENPSNNSVENLEWCTYKYNNNYGTKKQRLRIKRGKRVFCYETKEVYFSLHEASEKKKLPFELIAKVCRGERHTCGGFHWCFIDQQGKLVLNKSITEFKPRQTYGRIICLDTNIEYENAHDAARNLGLDFRRICTSCNKGTTYAGRHWRRIS